MSQEKNPRPTFIPEDEKPLKHSFVPPTSEYPPMPVPEIGEDKGPDK